MDLIVQWRSGSSVRDSDCTGFTWANMIFSRILCDPQGHCVGDDAAGTAYECNRWHLPALGLLSIPRIYVTPVLGASFRLQFRGAPSSSPTVRY